MFQHFCCLVALLTTIWWTIKARHERQHSCFHTTCGIFEKSRCICAEGFSLPESIIVQDRWCCCFRSDDDIVHRIVLYIHHRILRQKILRIFRIYRASSKFSCMYKTLREKRQRHRRNHWNQRNLSIDQWKKNRSTLKCFLVLELFFSENWCNLFQKYCHIKNKKNERIIV